jgi:beta-galactosidase
MRPKKLTCVWICVLLSPFITLRLSAQTGRNTLLFNNDWKFHKGDVVHGEAVDFIDGDWRILNLPHDWSIEGPFSEEWASGTAFLPGGIGWYRKTFTVPAATKNQKTYIYFDGVYKNSEVWINGHYLGKRPNGFVSFQYELTPYLKIGDKNVLAVRAEHSQFADSRWYTGSGIYRNVYLITTPPLHIGLWGVGFTTPEVSDRLARVNVKVAVVNGTVKTANVTIKCSLVNTDGKTVAHAVRNVSLDKTDSTLTDLAFTVKSPQLWSVNHPSLYRLIVSLTAGGKQTDEWRDKVGIRNMKFDANRGFFLNGKNMKLKGVCIHDDAGALGVAVPREVWYRRLKLLKEMGCNSLRMSHNPHAGYLYDLCDEMGFLVMEEAFDEWEEGKNKWVKGWNVGKPGNEGYNEYFKDWYDIDVRDMVLRGRNHPDIIMWSIGNEIDYPNDPYTDSILNTGRNPQIYGRGYLPDHPSARKLGELSKLLVDVVKKYDTSRPVTSALAGVVMSNTTTFPENLDVVGYNYQEYRYNEDHKTYPERIIYGSENSMQLSAWNAVDSNDYIAGQYLWTGIDYLGEARSWPSRSNGAGLLDLAGFPKPGYYFRQSLWSDKPMIYIGTADSQDSTKSIVERLRIQANPNWNYKSGDKIRVNCYTNCKEAELFLNGRSLGKKSLLQFADRVILWDVDYQPGDLIVKGYVKDGKDVSYSLATAGVPYAIAADTDMPFSNQQSGLLQLVIRVVDKNGVAVYGADNEITIKTEGPAKLSGLESGSLNSHEDYKSNSRKVFNGKLLAFIQRDSKPGIIHIVIQSPGLKYKTLIIKWC